jgi:hypothetical protein
MGIASDGNASVGWSRVHGAPPLTSVLASRHDQALAGGLFRFFDDLIATMRMRLSHFALICAGLAALVAGGWPVASRYYESYQRDAKDRERTESLARQTAEVKAELAAKKNEVMRELGEYMAAGKYADALKLAAKYRLAGDADVQAIIGRAGAVLSGQQLVSRMEQLVAKSCTGIQATATATKVLTSAFPEVKEASTADWVSERLDVAALLPDVRARLRELAESANKSKTPTQINTLDRVRGSHSMRLQPTIYQNIAGAQDPSALLCAWRIKGKWPEAAANAKLKPFDMVIWYAPSSNERTLEHDILRFTMR